jgi:glycosyltransferase involved in cell wall biosynthesis
MQKSAPLVSVVMSMRNSARTIEVAVRSVLVQTLSDFEFIIIDNGSSDESAALVAAIDDPRIRLVRETVVTVLAARLNQAVALSRGEFIARMDADDICFPDRLERQISELRARKHLHVVGCAAVVFRDDAILVGQLPFAATHDEIVARPFSGFPFPHPTWCGRADWFRDNPYGVIPPTAEDQDLLLRTFHRSQFGCLREVLLGYRQNELSLRKLLNGRRAYISSLLRLSQHDHEARVPVAKGVIINVVKGAADVVLMVSGLKSWAQRRRLVAVQPSTADRWNRLKDILAAA